MFKSSVHERIWTGWWGSSVEWKLSAKNFCAFTQNYQSTQSILIAQDDGTDIEFWNIGFYTLDAGEIPKRTQTTFWTRQNSKNYNTIKVFCKILFETIVLTCWAVVVGGDCSISVVSILIGRAMLSLHVNKLNWIAAAAAAAVAVTAAAAAAANFMFLLVQFRKRNGMNTSSNLNLQQVTKNLTRNI